MGNEDDFAQQERREQTLYSQIESHITQEPQNQQQSAEVDVKAESQSISEYDNTLEKA